MNRDSDNKDSDNKDNTFEITVCRGSDGKYKYVRAISPLDSNVKIVVAFTPSYPPTFTTVFPRGAMARGAMGESRNRSDYHHETVEAASMKEAASIIRNFIDEAKADGGYVGTEKFPDDGFCSFTKYKLKDYKWMSFSWLDFSKK